MARKLLFVFVTLLLISTAALAQRGRAKDLSGEFFGQEAFDRPLKYIAGSYAPEIVLTRWPESDCTPDTLNVSCFGIPDASQSTTKTLTNATRIVIPGKSLRDVLLINARNFYWTWERSDMTAPDMSVFVYQPTITIRSSTLTTPITANMGHHRSIRMITPEEGANFGGEDSQYTRDYRLTRSLMKLGMNMSDAQIDAFFDNDITIELNLEVRVKQYDTIDALYDLQIFGY